jgi:hypothetical protein
MARIRSNKKETVISSKLSITKEVLEIQRTHHDSYNTEVASDRAYNGGTHTFQPNGAPVIVAKSRKLYGVELNNTKARKDITDFAISVKDKSTKKS